MIATKEFQKAAVQDVEKLKAEKNALVKRKASLPFPFSFFPGRSMICHQEALNGEMATISEAITRTRSRIVQSPDRIKRTILTMNSAAIEDKKTLTIHEAKARELQGKINALLAIEKVRPHGLKCVETHVLDRIFVVVSSSFRRSKRKFMPSFQHRKPWLISGTTSIIKALKERN